MKPTVFIDMDGVTYNWYGAFFKMVGLDEKAEADRRILRSSDNAANLIFPEDFVFQKVQEAGYQFWENIPLLPWAHQLYDALTQKADVCFLTSPGRWIDAPKGKLLAIKRDFPGTNILIGYRKGYCAKPHALLIDDRPKNIAEFANAGGVGVCWPNQYLIEDGAVNADWFVEQILRTVDDLANPFGHHEKDAKV